MMSLSPGLGRHRHTLDADWPLEASALEKGFNSGKFYLFASQYNQHKEASNILRPNKLFGEVVEF